MCLSFRPYTCCMPCPSHILSSICSLNIWRWPSFSFAFCSSSIVW
jgi:hypothetical protein